MVFTSFYYYLRKQGLAVSMEEWLTLLDALNRDLAQSSLLEFYYLARMILVKRVSDYDCFDQAFLSYFGGICQQESWPQEILDHLQEKMEQQPYDREEVDRRTDLTYEQIEAQMMQRRREQQGTHNGGKHWIGTGGTSTYGNGGYSKTGIRVEGETGHQSALQVIQQRSYRDFREDAVLESQQFQIAFRRLRQMSSRERGELELDVDKTIKETCENGGLLRIAYSPPRKNAIKLLALFDSGGSMEPYSKLCSQLFQAVHQANHFSALKIFFFHNCLYNRVYTTPACSFSESMETDRLLQQITPEYRVIFVGDASLPLWELRYYTVGRKGRPGDQIDGLLWTRKLIRACSSVVWFNPIPEEMWTSVKGAPSIRRIREEVTMFPLTMNGLQRGIDYLLNDSVSAKRRNTPVDRSFAGEDAEVEMASFRFEKEENPHSKKKLSNM